MDGVRPEDSPEGTALAVEQSELRIAQLTSTRTSALSADEQDEDNPVLADTSPANDDRVYGSIPEACGKTWRAWLPRRNRWWDLLLICIICDFFYAFSGLDGVTPFAFCWIDPFDLGCDSRGQPRFVPERKREFCLPEEEFDHHNSDEMEPYFKRGPQKLAPGARDMSGEWMVGQTPEQPAGNNSCDATVVTGISARRFLPESYNLFSRLYGPTARQGMFGPSFWQMQRNKMLRVLRSDGVLSAVVWSWLQRPFPKFSNRYPGPAPEFTEDEKGGGRIAASMLGPLDSFGVVPAAPGEWHSIEVGDVSSGSKVPVWAQWAKNATKVADSTAGKLVRDEKRAAELLKPFARRIKGDWLSGGSSAAKQYVMKETRTDSGDNQRPLSGKSLFAARGVPLKQRPLSDASIFDAPGVLEINAVDGEERGLPELPLPELSAKLVEDAYNEEKLNLLASFKAKFVRNGDPFELPTISEAWYRKHYAKAIEEDKLVNLAGGRFPVNDYAPVSYWWGPRYASDYAVAGDKGTGVFLEFHDFSQVLTPLTPSSGGWVVLARPVNPNKDAEKVFSGPAVANTAVALRNVELEVVAVRIPFGYSLVVEKGCIHGDSTFQGLYMMTMTANAHVMNGANAVFLRQGGNGNVEKNVRLSFFEKGDSILRPLLVAPKEREDLTNRFAKSLAWTEQALPPHLLPLVPELRNLSRIGLFRTRAWWLPKLVFAPLNRGWWAYYLFQPLQWPHFIFGIGFVVAAVALLIKCCRRPGYGCRAKYSCACCNLRVGKGLSGSSNESGAVEESVIGDVRQIGSVKIVNRERDKDSP